MSNYRKENEASTKAIIKACIVAAILCILGLVFFAKPAKAGTAAPLQTNTQSVTCFNDAGEVTLYADGRKVRLAYWEGDTPYFTDARRTSRNKRVFAAPAGSKCFKNQ